MTSAERQRVEAFGALDKGLTGASPWYLWGPYLSERAWGTVREDYSPDGHAWEYFPHDHARSRAYRWSEDGLAGMCDVRQNLCLALALWNGEDPCLKERIFGLTGPQGNHGEDAKEYWWYLDAIPSHAWQRWRYHYPQREFPYARLVQENGPSKRGRHDPELELLDTGVFDDDRYWIVDVAYAKASPSDLLMRIRVKNAGPERKKLHVLPTLWFRNTWSWDVGAPRPVLRADGPAAVTVDHDDLGPFVLRAATGPQAEHPRLLFCENETNAPLLFDSPATTPFPKDGINDHVLHGTATVNPDGEGTKASAWYEIEVDPGETVELRLRLTEAGVEAAGTPGDLGGGFEAVMAQRQAEADEFYAELAPAETPPAEVMVMRQAFAGMLWSKQLYNYNVARWLAGDPAQPVPPISRRTGRNAMWRHMEAFDILSMPDKWEYPWFAAWDLSFHSVALANVDPAFAKYQLLVMCREWFQHPNGALPAYEWNFDDINPPVHAWAALQVFRIDGERDFDFLERVFLKLLLNFTWWVNREDEAGDNLFTGGFLGLDNIGPIDRSKLPPGWSLEQSDATGWMAFYCLMMLSIVEELANRNPAMEDLRIKFVEHFVAIARALNRSGLWDAEEGFYYDLLRTPDGSVTPVRVQSMVGLIPLLPSATVKEEALRDAEGFTKNLRRIISRLGFDTDSVRRSGRILGMPGRQRVFLSVVGADQIAKLLATVFDEEDFLSPHGLRSLSRQYRDHPYRMEVGGTSLSIDYEPAESQSGMFGGNSNWRGPVWFPLNYLVIEALARMHDYFGDDFLVEYPTGSGEKRTFLAIAEDLRRRLISLYLPGTDGRRPVNGGLERFQTDPEWKDNLLFYEYFHGDDGAGLGASHQTGWTGLIADLICRRPDGGSALHGP